jgi:predicted SnoaL-like aldol condensation-catalyzing enzyme
MNNKEKAVDFLQLVASGSVQQAYVKYVDKDFRHHNPFFSGDADSLRVAMEENAKQNPEKTLTLQHVVEDGHLVVVHSWVKLKSDDIGVALVHIFRFQNELIAELWDIVQAVPENSPNEYGMF